MTGASGQQAKAGANRTRSPAFAQGALVRILSSATSNPDGAAADLAALTVLDTAMEGLRSAVASLGDQRTALRVKYSGVIEDSVLASPGWLTPLEPVLDLTGRPLSQAQTVIDDRRGLISGVAAVADTAGQCSDQLDDLVPDINELSGETWDSLHGQWVSLLQDVLRAADGNALEPLKNRIDTLKQDVQNAPRSRDLTAVPQSGSRQDAAARRAFGQLAVRLRAGPPVVPGAPAAAAPVVVLGISATANMDTLLAVTVRTTGLAENTNLHWEFSDGARSAVFPAGGTDGAVDQAQFRFSGPEQAFANVVDENGRPVSPEPWRGDIGSFSFAQRLRAKLGANDRVVAIVAGVLAVGSGMAALYLTVPTWGSAGDYIAALLWGSVTSEGVKLVVNAVGKRWPLAS